MSPSVNILLSVSHIATHLGGTERKYYEQRAKELQEKWGLSPKEAERRTYAEMLHRFLPPGHPVLRYYRV